MIQIKVRNYRSVERADIDLDGIVLLAGDVESGKSSVCSAIGATLTQTAMAWPDVKKKDAAVLVRDATDQATISAGDAEADWETSISYPRAQVKSAGHPPHVHPIAAGMRLYTDLSPAERAELLSSVLPGDVTIEDMYEFGETVELEPKVVDACWERIGKDGWDGALAAAEDKGPEFRLKFQETTGTRWGSDKGATWTPVGWDPALLQSTEAELAAIATKAETAYQAAVKEGALDAAQLEQTQATADALPERQEKLKEARELLASAEAELEACEKEVDALPAPVAGITRHECPHCGGELDVAVKTNRKGPEKSITVSEPSADHDPETQAKVDRAGRARGQAERDLEERRRELADAEAAVEAAEAAKGRLAAREEGAAESPVADLLAVREAAKRNADMLARVLRARKIHAALKANTAIRRMLAMEGVRLTVLGRRVKRFNDEILAPLVARTAMGDRKAWPAVELHPDMTVTWGGRPWSLCSGSAQWRMNAVLALGFASAAAQPVVVLDGADILPAWGLNGLVSMLRGADVAAVVGMTATDPAKLPKLQKAGLGRVYWLGGGEGFARDFAEVH